MKKNYNYDDYSFHTACKNGDFENVKAFYNNKQDINKLDYDGNTPFKIVVREIDELCLIKPNMDLNDNTREKIESFCEIALHLLNKGAKVSREDFGEKNEDELVILKSVSKIVNFALFKGANDSGSGIEAANDLLNQVYKGDLNLLHYFCLFTSEEYYEAKSCFILQTLIELFPEIDINSKTKKGESVLYLACDNYVDHSKHLEGIKYLIEKGADVHIKIKTLQKDYDNSTYYTCTNLLKKAAFNQKNYELTKLLIENKVNLDISWHEKQLTTTLHSICSLYTSKFNDIIKLFVENGARLFIKNSANKTPVDCLLTGSAKFADAKKAVLLEVLKIRLLNMDEKGLKDFECNNITEYKEKLLQLVANDSQMQNSLKTMFDEINSELEKQENSLQENLAQEKINRLEEVKVLSPRTKILEKIKGKEGLNAQEFELLTKYLYPAEVGDVDSVPLGDLSDH